MQAEMTRNRLEWCAVRPTCADWLADLGLRSARDFLALPGVVVSGHVGRNVSRVQLGDTVGYIKREHQVRARDRFRSLMSGFGPASLSQRERIVIGRLDAHMLQSPHWLAVGEANGQAFLLLEQAHGAIDLRRLPEVSHDLARQLGRIIAGIHAAGIDQPDLFAKHFLVNPETEHVTVIDWQRASLRAIVSWRRRIRGLATLRATISEDMLSAEVWDCLLSAYQEAASRDEFATLQQPAALSKAKPRPSEVMHAMPAEPEASAKATPKRPLDKSLPGRDAPSRPVSPSLTLQAPPVFSTLPKRARSGLTLRVRVDELARALRRRRSIRSQINPPAAEQELIRIVGETVCAIPEIAEQLGQPDFINSLYDPDNDGRTFRFPNGRSGILRVSRYRSPLKRWWDAVRGKSWRSDELKEARLLFHLERNGIAGPNLLAYGQRVDGVGNAGSFVLFEPCDGRRTHARDAERLTAMLARLHEADCCLRSIGEDGEPFAMAPSGAAIVDARRLRLNRRLADRHKARDQRQLQQYLEGRQ